MSYLVPGELACQATALLAPRVGEPGHTMDCRPTCHLWRLEGGALAKKGAAGSTALLPPYWRWPKDPDETMCDSWNNRYARSQCSQQSPGHLNQSTCKRDSAERCRTCQLQAQHIQGFEPRRGDGKREVRFETIQTNHGRRGYIEIGNGNAHLWKKVVKKRVVEQCLMAL